MDSFLFLSSHSFLDLSGGLRSSPSFPSSPLWLEQPTGTSMAPFLTLRQGGRSGQSMDSGLLWDTTLDPSVLDLLSLPLLGLSRGCYTHWRTTWDPPWKEILWFLPVFAALTAAWTSSRDSFKSWTWTPMSMSLWLVRASATHRSMPRHSNSRAARSSSSQMVLAPSSQSLVKYSSLSPTCLLDWLWFRHRTRSPHRLRDKSIQCSSFLWFLITWLLW